MGPESRGLSRQRAVAAILITGLTVEPVRSLMKVYRCDWTKANPGQQGEAEPR